MCTGCGLCANVCPKDAISMEWSPDGFSIPRVNEERCINCGLCIEKCIALQPRNKRKTAIDSVNAFAAWNRNTSTHAESSSGGVFSALAEETLLHGGVVFGVIWQDNTTAVFSKATCPAELAPMRSSKYTQALPGKAYREAKEELLAGRRVLFAGTPCQIHALKQYLRRDYEKLLTIDVVCHGVPSRRLLEKYVAEAEQSVGKKIGYIHFRDKRKSWNTYSVTRHYADGSEQSTSKTQDNYMLLFLSDQCLNKSCYSCAFAEIPRQGDITVGDYWGVSSEEHPDWPIHRGVSAVLANSAKVQSALNTLARKEQLRLHPENFRRMYRWQKHSYVSRNVRRDHKRTQLLALLRSETPLDECTARYAHYYCRGIICLDKQGIFFRILKAIKRHLKALLK